MLRFIDLLRLVCKKTSNYREINRIIQVDSPRSIVFFGNEEEEEEEEEEKKGSNLTKTMVSVTKNFTMHYTSMDVQTIYKRLYELLKRLVFIEHDIYYTVVVNQHKYNRYSDYLMASYTNNADLLRRIMFDVQRSEHFRFARVRYDIENDSFDIRPNKNAKCSFK